MADEMTKFFGLDNPEGEKALAKECRKLKEKLYGPRCPRCGSRGGVQFGFGCYECAPRRCALREG